jgi:hypothetical protein
MQDVIDLRWQLVIGRRLTEVTLDEVDLGWDVRAMPHRQVIDPDNLGTICREPSRNV